MVTVINNGVERHIEENEVAHKIDEKIAYYIGNNFGYEDCYMFKWGTLSSASQALSGLEGVERAIGIGILKTIKENAINTINVNDMMYYIVPEVDVIDIYETYEHPVKKIVL